MNRQKREIRYDILRIFLVVLVVLGHGTYYTVKTKFGGIDYSTLMIERGVNDTVFRHNAALLTNWIYSFHMPVFIALSGTLYAMQMSKSRYKTLSDITKNKAKRLLVPLLFVWICWNIPIKYVSRYYYGKTVVDILTQIIFPNSVYLWYLEALFIDFILAYLISKKIRSNTVQNYAVLVLWIIGLFCSEKFKGYVPFGNPMKYLLWFWMGIKMDIIIQHFKQHKLWCNFKMLLLIILQIVLWIYTKKLKVEDGIIYQLILPALSIPILYYMAEFIGSKLSENSKDKIVKVADYSFGIYLYAEPLNYLIVWFMVNHYGITILGSEMGAMAIYILRVIGTPIVAVIIVKILKKMKLKYLY